MDNENVNKTENQQDNVIVKAKKHPSFFVDKSEISIQVFVVYNTLDGNIISASTYAIDEKLVSGVEQISYTFVFTKPNYQEMCRYRQLSMYWDNVSKQTIVNPFKLRNYIILNHLKQWKNVFNEQGQEVNLQLDIDNTLTQSSLQLVYTVNANIIDTVMDAFDNIINR